MNKDSWWVRYVDSQALGNEHEQTCKHKKYTLYEFCVMINDIAKKLGNGKILLDIGAGNGLNDIALAHLYDQIIAVEPATTLFEKLQKNIAVCSNIVAVRSYAESITFEKGTLFDRILIAGVAPQLDEASQLFQIFDSMLDNAASTCRILVARVSDLKMRDAYLATLPAILQTRGYSGAEIEVIMDRNRRASWHDYREIEQYFTANGFRVKKLATDPCQLLFDQKYDVIAERGEL